MVDLFNAMNEEIIIQEKEIAKLFVKEKVKATYELAKYLTKKYEIVTIGEKEREMYVYQNGYYRRAENLIIYPEIQRILAEQINKNAKSETFHKIADMTSCEREVFTNADLRYIPLSNGVYDLTMRVLLPHDPKYRFKYQFPIEYDKNAVCPKTEAYLDQVLTPTQRATIEEWMGYYFYRNYQFKKALIMVGEGDTGKTTLLEVITYLLGTENISSVSLHKMTADKFAAAHLYEKHGNIVDELSAKDVTDTGNFKIATGGGSITGEYKFGNQFSFVNFSKFTFACNKIPDVEDFDDEAYFNRWMVIRFEKTITKKIPNFIATLTTEEERSGLFNLAIRGLERLLENGKFTYSLTAADTKIEMMKNGSSISAFLQDKIIKDVNGKISNDDLYDAYEEYCDNNNLPCDTKSSLNSKLVLSAPYIKRIRMYALIDGKTSQVRGVGGISFRKTEEQIREEQEIEDLMSLQAQSIQQYNERQF